MIFNMKEGSICGDIVIVKKYIYMFVVNINLV